MAISQPGGPPGRPSIFDIQGFVRKFIPFSQRFITGFKSGRGQYLDCNFTSANSDQSFTIALGHVPSMYVMVLSNGGFVKQPTSGTSLWTANSITLQCTSTGHHLLWVN